MTFNDELSVLNGLINAWHIFVGPSGLNIVRSRIVEWKNSVAEILSVTANGVTKCVDLLIAVISSLALGGLIVDEIVNINLIVFPTLEFSGIVISFGLWVSLRTFINRSKLPINLSANRLSSTYFFVAQSCGSRGPSKLVILCR